MNKKTIVNTINLEEMEEYIIKTFPKFWETFKKINDITTTSEQDFLLEKLEEEYKEKNKNKYYDNIYIFIKENIKPLHMQFLVERFLKIAGYGDIFIEIMNIVKSFVDKDVFKENNCMFNFLNTLLYTTKRNVNDLMENFEFLNYETKRELKKIIKKIRLEKIDKTIELIKIVYNLPIMIAINKTDNFLEDLIKFLLIDKNTDIYKLIIKVLYQEGNTENIKNFLIIFYEILIKHDVKHMLPSVKQMHFLNDENKLKIQFYCYHINMEQLETQVLKISNYL